MRKKVGAKKVGARRGKEGERVLGLWRVAAAKGQVPRGSEDGNGPTRVMKAVGKKALETRRCSLCVFVLLALWENALIHYAIYSINKPHARIFVFSSRTNKSQTHRHVALSPAQSCISGQFGGVAATLQLQQIELGCAVGPPAVAVSPGLEEKEDAP